MLVGFIIHYQYYTVGEVPSVIGIYYTLSILHSRGSAARIMIYSKGYLLVEKIISSLNKEMKYIFIYV